MTRDLVGRNVRTSNKSVWKITSIQRRRLAHSSDRGHISRYFECGKSGWKYHATMLASLKSDCNMVRAQNVLSALDKNGAIDRYLQERNLKYLAMPKILETGTFLVYRFLITDMDDLNQYMALRSRPWASTFWFCEVYRICLTAIEFLHVSGYVHGGLNPHGIWIKLILTNVIHRVCLVDYEHSMKFTHSRPSRLLEQRWCRTQCCQLCFQVLQH